MRLGVELVFVGVCDDVQRMLRTTLFVVVFDTLLLILLFSLSSIDSPMFFLGPNSPRHLKNKVLHTDFGHVLFTIDFLHYESPLLEMALHPEGMRVQLCDTANTVTVRDALNSFEQCVTWRTLRVFCHMLSQRTLAAPENVHGKCPRT